MQSTDDLDAVLGRFGRERRGRASVPALEGIQATGRRLIRRRRIRRATIGALTSITVVIAVTQALPIDRGDRMVTTEVGPSSSGDAILELAGSSDDLPRGGGLLELVATPEGDVWAVWQGLGISRYDGTLRERLRLEEQTPSPERPCCRKALAPRLDGRVLTLGAVLGSRTDGHGDQELMAVLTEIDASGSSERIVTTFPGEVPGITLAIAGDLALIRNGPTLHAVRIGDGTLIATATVGPSPMAVADDSVWVATKEALVRLSLPDLRELERLDAVADVVSVGDTFWALTLEGSLKRLDSEVEIRFTADNQPLALDGQGAYLWVKTQASLLAIDAYDGNIIAETKLGRRYGAFAAFGDQAWVEEVAGTESKIHRYTVSTPEG